MPKTANNRVDTEAANREETHAVSDAANAGTMDTDPNGASTAVGVSHPENRRPGPHVRLPDEQPYLDDYDTDGTVIDYMPPDEDEGRSFPGLKDTAEEDGLASVDKIDNIETP